MNIINMNDKNKITINTFLRHLEKVNLGLERLDIDEFSYKSIRIGTTCDGTDIFANRNQLLVLMLGTIDGSGITTFKGVEVLNIDYDELKKAYTHISINEFSKEFIRLYEELITLLKPNTYSLAK